MQTQLEIANTNLLAAVKAGNSEMVLQALNNGANPNLQDTTCSIGGHKECSVLHHAVWSDSSDSVKYLINYGASVNVETPRVAGYCWGDTPLHWAASHGNPDNFEIIRLLMKKGVIHTLNHGSHYPICSAMATNNLKKANFIHAEINLQLSTLLEILTQQNALLNQK